MELLRKADTQVKNRKKMSILVQLARCQNQIQVCSKAHACLPIQLEIID